MSWWICALLSLVPALPSEGLEVTVTDRRGLPVADLTPADFRLTLDDSTATVVSAEPSDRRRHFLVLFDLPSSSPAERRRVLPPLRQLVDRRLQLGDRVTIALLRRRPSAPPVDLLCTFCDDPRAVASALDEAAKDPGLAFHQRGMRRIDDRTDLKAAYETLAQALNLALGDGLSTQVIYLGRWLAGSVSEGRLQTLRSIAPADKTETSDSVGSIQYLVSLPRSGPLQSKARSAGTRLLQSALGAEATIYPLVPGERPSSLDHDLWLAEETGGRPLSIRDLEADLKRLEQQLETSYWLSYAGLPESETAFRRLKVEAEGRDRSLEVRHLRGLPALDETARLALRAQSAWLLGNEIDNLGLQAFLVPLSDDGRFALDLIVDAPREDGRFSLSLALPDDDRWITRRQELPFTVSSESPLLRLRIPLVLPKGAPGLGLALSDGAGKLSAKAVPVQ